ncbi:preprotein translocase subunit SecY [Mycoplasma sp. SG1]|uniref:preprotein translocase subunit SecY n=1 Tax=Mycoplasma sp. SG1 TaxID=2810348 RepID=UPI002023D0F3|nr:preprotein translocase subunit SecY [Mycoplasma sp. SG1]URM52909.1 preprotein translocase subunit SecY [Mycoplasma sp. SG1]
MKRTSFIQTFIACFKIADIRWKILFTIMVLVVFRIGSNIMLPGSQDNVSDNGTNTFFGMMSMLGGGNLRRLSVFSLGVSPYVMATIITQLLSADIIPSWTKMAKSGELGRKKLDLVARFLTIFIAIIQGFAILFTMKSQKYVDTSTAGLMLDVVIIVAGSFIALWLGDQISAHGIGNGTSMIIFSGIIANIPWNFVTIFDIYFGAGAASSAAASGFSPQSIFLGILNIIVIVILIPIIIILTIYLTQSLRKIPVQQLGSGISSSPVRLNYLMFKINSAGVIPVIFASSLLSIPLTISGLIAKGTPADYWINMFFSVSYVPGLIFYFILTIIFTFFYSHIMIKPDELSKNLQRNGSYIPGIKPGLNTENYIVKVLNRLNLIGGIALALIASTPYLIFIIIKIPSNMVLGGTGIIIMVGVAIDVVTQLIGRVKQKQYVLLSQKAKSELKQQINLDQEPEAYNPYLNKTSSHLDDEKSKETVFDDDKDDKNKKGSDSSTILW